MKSDEGEVYYVPNSSLREDTPHPMLNDLFCMVMKRTDVIKLKSRLTTLGVHLSHCNFGENVNCCKYGDEDCPALTHGWSWFGNHLQRSERILADERDELEHRNTLAGAPINFRKELRDLLNRHSKEVPSSTPDYLLADYLIRVLEAYDNVVIQRDADLLDDPDGIR